MNGSDSATKADIEQLRTELKQDIGQLRTELKQDNEQLHGELSHQYNDLVERISDAETRIVKAIYEIANAGNKRMAHIEGDNAAMNNRLATMEERILELERRVNLRPAA